MFCAPKRLGALPAAAEGGGPAGVVEPKEKVGLLEAGVAAPAGADVVAAPEPKFPKRLGPAVWPGVVAGDAVG